MSSQSYSTFTSSAYSSVTDLNGNSYTQSSHSNPSGTTVQTTSKAAGQPAVSETTRLPAGSRGTQHVEGSAGTRRIEDVTDQDYDERIEDEYARREGGA